MTLIEALAGMKSYREKSSQKKNPKQTTKKKKPSAISQLLLRALQTLSVQTAGLVGMREYLLYDFDWHARKSRG